MKKFLLPIFLLLLFTCPGHAEAVYSQDARISLNKQQTALRDVLEEIEQQSDYLFISNREANLDQKVTVHAENKPVREILDEILVNTDISYVVEGVNIILSKRAQAPQPTPQAQQRTVIVTVLDEAGDPIIGASVIERGTTNGGITGVDGTFTLPVAGNNAVVQASFLGYTTREVLVGTQTNMTVTLSVDTQVLDEVVVVGYGVQQKKLVTGANIQVKGEDVSKRNTQNALDALVGQSPGVQISQSSGQPGEDFRVSIRGLGTVGNATPLYIVDGVQSGSISHINPSEIESIDVLKDAASAAIYGARAANGVIIITTKTGKVGRATISYDAYVGFQNPPKLTQMLNAQEYAMIQNEAARNSGRNPYDWKQEFGIDLATIGNGTNWLEEIIQRNAISQNHVVSALGGTEQSIYSMSLSYSSQEGVFGGSKVSGNDRYTFRVNTEHKIYKDIIKIGEHASFSYTERKGVSTGGEGSNLIRNAIEATPFLPVYDANGDYHQALPWYPEESNPVGSMNLKNMNLTDTNKFQADVYLEVQPIKGLRYKSTFGLDFTNIYYRRYMPVYQLSATDMNQMDYVEQRATKAYSYSWENIINYDFKVSDHTFNALLGMQAQRSGGHNLYAQKKELTFSDFDHAWLTNATNVGTGQVTATGAPADLDNLVSYFGRLSYNYREKYLFTGTMRADASSRFGANNRWGYFPSVSAGWVLTNEDFLSQVRNIVEFLKLRVSWGQNGNQNITAYSYLATIQSNANYEFGANDNTNTSYVGSYQNRMPNPNIKWETSEQFDVGLDAQFVNGRLSVALDYYSKTTKDWLVQVPVAAVLGAATNPFINGGSIRNSGVELAMSYRSKPGKFTWSINGNMAYNKNKVLDIPNSEGIIHGSQDVLFHGMQEMNRAQTGYPIGYFWGLDMVGIFQTREEIENWKNSKGKVIQPTALPGDVKFVDHNDDGQIDMSDNIDLGNPYPDITMGLSVSLAYKGFDFFLSSNGSFGHQIAQSYRTVSRFQSNYPKKILGRWTGEGTSNKYPRVTQGDDTNGNWRYNSQLYIENGDFWRINNVTLGYDFATLFKNSPLGQFRLYASVQNLLTVTKYSGMDPDVGYFDSRNAWGSGIDLGYYPRPRTILLGVNVKF